MNVCIECSGQPLDADNDQLRALVKANICTTVQELASELDATYMMISNHPKKIEKMKKLNKWVPHELSNNQKKHCYKVSSLLLLCNKNDPFLNQIVTCDEKWVLYSNAQLSGSMPSSTTLSEATVAPRSC